MLNVRSKPAANRLRKQTQNSAATSPCSCYYCRGIWNLLVLVLRHIEETDDAYVAGNRVKSWRRCCGSVTKVWADNTDFVKEGDKFWSRSIRLTPNKRLKSQNGAGSSVCQTHQLMINSKQLQANIDAQKPPRASAKRPLTVVPLVRANLLAEAATRPRCRRQRAVAQLDVSLSSTHNANRAMILNKNPEDRARGSTSGDRSA